MITGFNPAAQGALNQTLSGLGYPQQQAQPMQQMQQMPQGGQNALSGLAPWQKSGALGMMGLGLLGGQDLKSGLTSGLGGAMQAYYGYKQAEEEKQNALQQQQQQAQALAPLLQSSTLTDQQRAVVSQIAQSDPTAALSMLQESAFERPELKQVGDALISYDAKTGQANTLYEKFDKEQALAESLMQQGRFGEAAQVEAGLRETAQQIAEGEREQQKIDISRYEAINPQIAREFDAIASRYGEDYAMQAMQINYGLTPDAASRLSAETKRRGQDVDLTKAREGISSQEAIASLQDATKRYGIDTSATTTERGQNLALIEARERIDSEERMQGRELTKREKIAILQDETERLGIETGAATTRRGQDVTQQGQLLDYELGTEGLRSREAIASLQDLTARRGQDVDLTKAREGIGSAEKIADLRATIEKYKTDVGADLTREEMDQKGEQAAARLGLDYAALDQEGKLEMQNQALKMDIATMADLRAAEDQELKKYGIDTTAATTRRGQDVTSQGQLLDYELGGRRIASQEAIAGADRALKRYNIDTGAQLSREEMTQAGQQFTARLGFDYKKLSQDEQLALDKMALQEDLALRGFDIDEERLLETGRSNRMNESLSLQRLQQEAGGPSSPIGKIYADEAAGLVPEGTAAKSLAKQQGTTVNVAGGEGTFTKEMGKLNAQKFISISDASETAQAQNRRLDNLQTVLSDPAVYQGAGAGLVNTAKSVGKALGLDVQGLSGAQLSEAINNELVLNKAGEMKGALSDKDLSFLKKTVPNLGHTREANLMKIQTQKILNLYDTMLAEEAAKYMAANDGVFNAADFNLEWKPDLDASYQRRAKQSLDTLYGR